MRTNGYAGQSRAFLAQARRELDQGDLVQASEKLWGAAAQMVKAVAERHGWPHHSHRDLYLVVRNCVQETRDEDLRRLFALANDLHQNFYENREPPEFVRDAVPDIERFLEKLERL